MVKEPSPHPIKSFASLTDTPVLCGTAVVPLAPLTTPASSVFVLLPVYKINSSSINIIPTKVTASVLLCAAIVEPSEALVREPNVFPVFVAYRINSLFTFIVPLDGKEEASATVTLVLYTSKSELNVVDAVSKSEALVKGIEVTELLIPVDNVVAE